MTKKKMRGNLSESKGKLDGFKLKISFAFLYILFGTPRLSQYLTLR